MMMGIASPTKITDAPAVTTPPATVETELKPPVPETVLHMQWPIVESQLGASYINNQSQQVTHNYTNISVCTSDPEAQENLRSHFNEKLHDKIYTTFKELFSNTNIDSLYKILPKNSMYNNEITRYVEDINVKCGILLNHTQKFQKYITGWSLFKYQLSQAVSQNPNNHKSHQCQLQNHIQNHSVTHYHH